MDLLLLFCTAVCFLCLWNAPDFSLLEKTNNVPLNRYQNTSNANESINPDDGVEPTCTHAGITSMFRHCVFCCPRFSHTLMQSG